jgi:hypothetical protein
MNMTKIPPPEREADEEAGNGMVQDVLPMAETFA